MSIALAALEHPCPLIRGGVIDALLKLGFGMVMLFAHPALTFA
ncbi:hypothetical protein [Nonomuraea sp. NPDC046570]